LDHPDLTPIAGDVLNSVSVENAIKGHDAVVVTLGAGMKGGVRSIGTQHVINGMKHHGIHRLICLSTLGAGNSSRYLNFFWKYIMFGILLRNALADHEAQEVLVRDSELDWTIVRPAAFIDGPATDSYKHGFKAADEKLKLKVSRLDVANFMLKGLNNDFYLHQEPSISY